MSKDKSFHHGDLKRVLFEVAISLLDQLGAKGVTIRAVAREAKVSHSAPVNHYKDRRALLTAIAQRQFESILAEIETALSKTAAAPKNRIKVFANALMDFSFRYPHRYQLLWRGDLIDHENPDLLAVMDQIYDQLCAEIENAVPGDRFDTDTIAVAMWSMVHGYVDMRLSGMFVPIEDSVRGTPRREAIIELFLSSLPISAKPGKLI